MQAGGRRFDPGTLHYRAAAGGAPAQSVTPRGVWCLQTSVSVKGNPMSAFLPSLMLAGYGVFGKLPTLQPQMRSDTLEVPKES